MTKTATVKLTAAIAIAGQIYRAGNIVTVPEEAAKNLLHRGKAELATAEDEALPLADDAGEDEPEAEATAKAKPKKK